MKVPKCRIECAASKEKLKYALDAVQVDVEKQRLVASNGRMAAVVPCEIDKSETGGLVPLAAFKAARKGGKKAESMASIVTNGKVEVITRDGKSEMPFVEGVFPDIDRVFPDKPTTEPTIILDAALLFDLQKALTGKDDLTGLKLWITDHKSGVFVRPTHSADEGQYGLILPINRS